MVIVNGEAIDDELTERIREKIKIHTPDTVIKQVSPATYVIEPPNGGFIR